MRACFWCILVVCPGCLILEYVGQPIFRCRACAVEDAPRLVALQASYTVPAQNPCCQMVEFSAAQDRGKKILPKGLFEKFEKGGTKHAVLLEIGIKSQRILATLTIIRKTIFCHTNVMFRDTAPLQNQQIFRFLYIIFLYNFSSPLVKAVGFQVFLVILKQKIGYRHFSSTSETKAWGVWSESE